MYTVLQLFEFGAAVRTWCISSSVCYVRTKLTVMWVDGGVESVLCVRLDTYGLPCRCGGVAFLRDEGY